MTDPRFRAAYDFLLLRGAIEGGELAELAAWWTHYQQVSPDERSQLAQQALASSPATASRKPRRRRSGGKRSNSKSSGDSGA